MLVWYVETIKLYWTQPVSFASVSFSPIITLTWSQVDIYLVYRIETQYCEDSSYRCLERRTDLTTSHWIGRSNMKWRQVWRKEAVLLNVLVHATYCIITFMSSTPNSSHTTKQRHNIIKVEEHGNLFLRWMRARHTLRRHRLPTHWRRFRPKAWNPSFWCWLLVGSRRNDTALAISNSDRRFHPLGVWRIVKLLLREVQSYGRRFLPRNAYSFHRVPVVTLMRVRCTSRVLCSRSTLDTCDFMMDYGLFVRAGWRTDG
jgi:hypothetical protein